MIPTLILVGIVVGLLPRPWYLVGIVAAGIAWPLLRAISGPTAIDGLSMLGEFAIAAANAAAGTVIARLLVNFVRVVRG